MTYILKNCQQYSLVKYHNANGIKDEKNKMTHSYVTWLTYWTIVSNTIQKYHNGIIKERTKITHWHVTWLTPWKMMCNTV